MVKVSFDADKREATLEKRGIDMIDAAKVFAGPTATWLDDRFDYGEPRYRAYGLIDGIAYCLVFTIRNERYRPISLRRAQRN